MCARLKAVSQRRANAARCSTLNHGERELGSDDKSTWWRQTPPGQPLQPTLLGCRGPAARTKPKMQELARLHVTDKGEPAMAATSSRKSSQAKVSAYRRRLRAQGLRPIQIWVPDVRAPGFKAQAHRQSLAVATSLQANEDQSFIDAVSDFAPGRGP